MWCFKCDIDVYSFCSVSESSNILGNSYLMNFENVRKELIEVWMYDDLYEKSVLCDFVFSLSLPLIFFFFLAKSYITHTFQ